MQAPGAVLWMAVLRTKSRWTCKDPAGPKTGRPLLYPSAPLGHRERGISPLKLSYESGLMRHIADFASAATGVVRGRHSRNARGALDAG